MSSLAYAVPSMLPSPPDINAKGYVLMDFDSGKIIASGNENMELAPASLTKIMTAYVAGQEMNSGRLSFDDTVTVGRNAWSSNRKFADSSKMFIEPGDNISVENILHGVMVQSGNDASVAIAEHVAGSEDAFVTLMNGWAAKLGMKNTQFINAHGLDGRDISTSPMDMAILARAMIHDTPDVYKIYGEKSFTWNGITQSNRNRLLWDNSLNVDGMKTGYTSGAGYNLVTSATEGDMRLISVVMGTPNQKVRLEESRKLLTYGFRFFETDVLLEEDETAITSKVWKGKLDMINLGIDEDAALTLPRGQMKDLKVEYSVNEPLQAPIAEGDVLGVARWTLNGEVVMEHELEALTAVEQGGFFKRLLDSIKLFFSGLFGGMLA
ncbi:serine hydrolase [Parendozoicomonas haliclonae]|nr:serine hydrolase [Parendozoicomonas haliclonae]